MIKKILSVTVILIFLGLGIYVLFQPKIVQFSNKNPIPSPEPEKPIKLVFTGDIMLDRGVAYQVQKQGNNDFAFPFLKIADYLKTVDLVFGNLESQISDKGTKIGSIYSFRADPKAIEGLEFAGFEVLSLANNHAFDYGPLALQDSMERLIKAGISPLGAGTENQAFAPVIKTINGSASSPPVRIAFFAYSEGPETWQATENNIGIAIVSDKTVERIKQDIDLAKQLADIVIVSLHAGNEYDENPSQSQIDFSHAFIDAGADLVVGHHPHIVQKSEIYLGKHIFYSLGNFVFDQGFSPETMAGGVLEVEIKDKKISKTSLKTIKINEFFQPQALEL